VTVTIYDVAHHARVSVATVSRVVSGVRVRPDLAERVQVSVIALGYQPNRMAQRMRTSTSHLWALIVPDFENVFFTRLARGLEQVCRPRDMCVFIGSSDNDPTRERHYLEVALAERVGGVVITPAANNTDLSRLEAAGIPVVIVDRALPGVSYDTVLCDNRAGGRLAAGYLDSSGYRRAVCISGPPNPTSQARVDGFIEKARESNSLIVETIRRGNNKFDGGYSAMKSIILSGAVFDAVFVSNNLMGVGAMKALEEADTIRHDAIGFVGFDLTDFPFLVGNGIASINQDPHEMGRLAGERILLRQKDFRLSHQVFELEPTLSATPRDLADRLSP
jgi:LacI family transcriptional regulator